MNPLTTREALERFGRAFAEHDATLLDGLAPGDLTGRNFLELVGVDDRARLSVLSDENLDQSEAAAAVAQPARGPESGAA